MQLKYCDPKPECNLYYLKANSNFKLGKLHQLRNSLAHKMRQYVL